MLGIDNAFVVSRRSRSGVAVGYRLLNAPHLSDCLCSALFVWATCLHVYH